MNGTDAVKEQVSLFLKVKQAPDAAFFPERMFGCCKIKKGRYRKKVGLGLIILSEAHNNFAGIFNPHGLSIARTI